MTSMTLHLSDEKHARLESLAAARGMSLHALMDEATTTMLAEYDAEMRFRARAKRGDRERGLALLDRALAASAKQP